MSLFPFFQWIGSYNLTWLTGDLIAGITVALVVVPQSMSYALLANLPPEYGLYSSFVGVMIYALFATSKDVTIGPVAVMSLQTGNVVTRVMAATNNEWSAPVIASALAFMCGVITFGIGMIRLGWIVEFIPAPAVSGFMTGSAITIAAGQVPKLMGIKGVQTNGNPAYLNIIQSLKGLPITTIDAAFGLTTLFFLYAWRYAMEKIPRRYPRTARLCFFLSVLRSAFVIIVLTIASRLWLGQDPKKPPISILKDVPRGFRHIGAPNLSTRLISDLAPELPVSTIVLLLEHIAISKSFGRLNNYKINPNQELIAMGVTNLVGPAFGGYAATGSFSRTAIKSKSGVRTPLAGWITGVVVIIALYALTGVFYYIPNAALAAVIIHAVVPDLVAPPAVLYRFWLVNPLELIIWAAAVIVTIFTNVENGVYVSVGASLVLLLVRIARPRGRWLGVVRVSHGDGLASAAASTINGVSGPTRKHRSVFVPLDDKDGLRDPSIQVKPPPPGVLIYRFEEAVLYPNASHTADLLIDKAKEETRPGNSNRYAKRGDRPWNDPGPINPVFRRIGGALRGKSRADVQAKIDAENAALAGLDDPRPVLKAFVFDFGSVSHVDTTSIQTLVDVRRAVELYAAQNVEFHFANILSPWIRRALLAGGFGTGEASRHITEFAPVAIRDALPVGEEQDRQRAEDERRRQAVQRVLHARDEAVKRAQQQQQEDDIEKASGSESPIDSGSDSKHASLFDDNKGGLLRSEYDNEEIEDQSMTVPVIWGNDLTPLFHLDLASAVDAAAGDGY